MNTQIKTMLIEAYYQLGIQSVWEIDRWLRQAMDYLRKDRERYIEAAEPNVSPYKITTRRGVICRLIPLAYSAKEDLRKKEVTVLSLMVTESDVRYVLSHYHGTPQEDSPEVIYSFPTCYYAQDADIGPDLRPVPPQEITPVATPLERELFGMAFMAMANYCKHLSINYIPHKTERAIFALDYTPTTELTLDGKTVAGRLLPLARQNALYDELREDHRYSCQKELCLLVEETSCRYILKTVHIYNYFQKIIVDDTPGGCIYQDTETKQEITWQQVTAETFPEDLHALYF